MGVGERGGRRCRSREPEMAVVHDGGGRTAGAAAS